MIHSQMRRDEGSEGLARISSDVCLREHYWQDGQPLSFSDGEILCFCIAKNCKVSRVNPPSV